MSASPEVPVAWTDDDEITLQWYAERLSGGYLSNADAALFAREILRLRAENERHRAYTALIEVEATARDGGWNEAGLLAVGNALIARADEIAALRSELAATRERETPFNPDQITWEAFHSSDPPHYPSRSFGVEWEAREWMKGRDGYTLVRSTTSRSRVSDNG